MSSVLAVWFYRDIYFRVIFVEFLKLSKHLPLVYDFSDFYLRFFPLYFQSLISYESIILQRHLFEIFTLLFQSSLSYEAWHLFEISFYFQSSSSFESAILGEAHGLITDMLADQSLPLNIVSGLRTLSNLLKPPESHSSFHKTRVSPLVSLTESTSYGSDTEENPYTGERPSTKVRQG